MADGRKVGVGMNSPGVAALWIQTPDGVQVQKPNAASRAEQEQQVIVMQVLSDEGLTINLVFRRTDFGRWLAHPNEPDEAIEVAINLEEE